MMEATLNKVLAGKFQAFDEYKYGRIVIETTSLPFITVFIPFERDRRKKVTGEQVKFILGYALEEFYQQSKASHFTDKARLESAEAYETLKAILAHPSTQRYLK